MSLAKEQREVGKMLLLHPPPPVPSVVKVWASRNFFEGEALHSTVLQALSGFAVGSCNLKLQTEAFANFLKKAPGSLVPG